MKERLTGAIILVALIVLLVPELLTGPLRGKAAPAGTMVESSPASRAAQRSGSDRSVLHSSPALPFLSAPHARSRKPKPRARSPIRSYTLPLSAATQVRAVGQGAGEAPFLPRAPVHRSFASSAPPAPRSPPRSTPSSRSLRAAPPISAPARPAAHGRSQGGARAPPRQASPPRAVEPGPSTPSAGKPRAPAHWVVQLASFTDHANALRLAERLRLQHLPVAIAPLRLRGRMWWRVWVGPVSRAAAGRLAQRLRPIAQGEVLRE